LQDQEAEISKLKQEIAELKSGQTELALFKEEIMELRESLGLTAIGGMKDLE